MEKAEGQDKKSIYKELLGDQNPEAIFILSGGTVKRERGITTASYSDLQGEFGVLGGKARIIAAAELAEYFPETKLVLTATYYPTPSDPSQSSIMSQELIKLGVNKNQIVQEEVSKSTYDELREIVNLSLSENWKNIAILTNGYHVPRAEEMLNRLDELASDKDDDKLVKQVHLFKEKTRKTFISAEEILPHRSTHYKGLLDELYQSEDYAKRLESEKRGVDALKSGTYGKSK